MFEGDFMNRMIGVFDSGIGGLTTLSVIRDLLPNENFLYYADSKNNPYGEKSEEELFTIVCNIVELLIKRDVKIIVVACNTATTKCIKKLREKYSDMIFIGTEPAIKVACDKNYKNTLVMATPGTIKSERVHDLIRMNKKPDQKITLLSCKGLADTIEFGTKDDIDKLLKKLLKKYVNKNIDSIVLGCTHYPHCKRNIRKIFPDIELIDGNMGVAKQVKKVLEENNLLSDSDTFGKVQMIYNK